MPEREILIDLVAQEFGLEKSLLISKSRKRELSIIRQCTAEVLNSQGMDYKLISNLLGRERTFFYYAVPQSNNNRQREIETQNIYKRIETILGGNCGKTEN